MTSVCIPDPLLNCIIIGLMFFVDFYLSNCVVLYCIVLYRLVSYFFLVILIIPCCIVTYSNQFHYIVMISILRFYIIIIELTKSMKRFNATHHNKLDCVPRCAVFYCVFIYFVDLKFLFKRYFYCFVVQNVHID